MATDDYNQAAKTYLAGARQAIEDLERLRSGPHDSRDVAQHYDRINQGMKLAEVCAAIGRNDLVRELIDVLDDGRLTPDEVDQLVFGATDRIA